MNKIFLLINTIFFLFFHPELSQAGGEFRSVGSKALGMGNCFTTTTDLWSVFNNQATLAYQNKLAAGLYYENKFSIRELGYKAGALALPTKHGTIGLSISNFGFEAWNETRFGVAYAKSFNDKFSIGAQLDYDEINQDEAYEKLKFITFELGFFACLSEKVAIGAHAYNPLNSPISNLTDEKSQSSFQIGVKYNPSQKLALYIETEKRTSFKPQLKTGAEYELTKSFIVRTGISTNPAILSFGAGIKYRNMIFDFGAAKHHFLGFSPAFSCICSF